MDSRDAPFADHVADLVAGFEAAAGRLAESEVQDRIVALAEKRDELRCRVLTRSTASFVSLLQMRGSHEERSASLPAMTQESAWLLREEARQLDDGCVPVFEMDVRRGILLSGTGERRATGRDTWGLWKDRFRTLADHEAVAGQSQLLRRSLELGLEDPDWAPPSASPAPVSSDRRRTRSPAGAIEAIVDAISIGAQRTAGHIWWPTSIQHSSSRHELVVTRSGMYDGLGGVVLAAAAAAGDSAKAAELYTCTSASLLRALEQFTAPRPESADRTIALGLGEGPIGAALALAEAARLRGDVETRQRLESVCASLDHLNLVVSTPDHLNGAAGIALAAVQLEERHGFTGLPRIRKTSADRLTELTAEALRDRRVEPGLAHGMSGIILGLSATSRGQDAMALASECFDLEDEMLLIAGDAGGGEQTQKALSGSWCWGATGQMEARLWVGHGRGMDRLRERMMSARLGGASLCHGLLGRALLMQSESYREQWGDADARHVRGAMLPPLLDDPLGARFEPHYARRVGLFTGFAGTLLYLAAHRDRASVRLSSLRYDRD